MAIYDDLIRAADDCPDSVALEFAGDAVSYQELLDQSRCIAAGLSKMGVKHGDAVGVMLPNVSLFVSIVYGTFFSGGTVTPISVLLTSRELLHVVRDSALKVIFVFDELLPIVEKFLHELDRPLRVIVVGEHCKSYESIHAVLDTPPYADFAPIKPDEHLLTLYTSGTTGQSKGVMISDRCMRSQASMIASAFDLGAGTRILCVLPLFHAYGLNALMNMTIRNRMTMILQEKFVVEECADGLANNRVQWFAGVPTMYALLLSYGKQNPDLTFPDLEVCLAGGAAMNKSVLLGFEQRFGAPIYEGYGLTETTVSTCSNVVGEGGRKIGSVGRPYSEVEAKVIDDQGKVLPAGEVGELAFRGDNVMLGYLNQPDATDEVLKDGWLYSGDLGYLDDEEFCFIVGRKKDLIIKSGYNIFPLEIEDVILKSFWVREAAVVGVPDPIRGERVLAAIVLDASADSDVAKAEIIQAVQTSLAKYKHPNMYWFVDVLPKGASGKILKEEIRKNWMSHDDLGAVI